MTNPVVFVDDREPSRIAEQIAAYGCTVSVGHFESGDYITYPHGLSVAIERKTISNMLGSMATKQIVTQAHRLVEQHDLAVILREGAFRRSPSQHLEYHDPRHPDSDATGWVKSGWAWSSWQGMQFDLWLMGIVVWDCPMMGEAAQDIASIAHTLAQDSHSFIRERERPNVLSLSTQWRNVVWALSAFDGIGPETAEKLLKQKSFADVISLAATDPKALTAVSGFGAKRAEHLHEEVVATYGTGG